MLYYNNWQVEPNKMQSFGRWFTSSGYELAMKDLRLRKLIEHIRQVVEIIFVYFELKIGHTCTVTRTYLLST